MVRKLRIVHCFRSPVGGIFRHVRDLTDAQIAAGHEVGIICDSTTGGDYEDMKNFGAYIFYRAGITPDGRWRFFVSGD